MEDNSAAGGSVDVSIHPDIQIPALRHQDCPTANFYGYYSVELSEPPELSESHKSSRAVRLTKIKSKILHTPRP